MIPIAQTGRYDLASWADARLIAAAPALLAACKMVVATGVYNEKTNNGVWTVDGPTVLAVLAALDKAEKGEQA